MLYQVQMGLLEVWELLQMSRTLGNWLSICWNLQGYLLCRAVEFARPRTADRTYDNDFVELMQSLRAKITHDGPNAVGSTAA